ncbi:amino acid adenylation domain-containing protein [Streptomyces sp. NPDC002561]|uniref:amino acid adenylation domain-containing protein n=1 Tax=unclassified Streptomyces TaxID=2593676 RepID=UPI0011E71F89|nr:amino acid adenylation domain-containing protein [Streptomyces sp. sk2.1]TXS61444.1 amino acid adenylation domain-containing protein [Streptomyces sp. sk2.1]
MNTSVPELIARVAADFPDRRAVRDPAGHLTYRELLAGAGHWERVLRAQGVAAGDTVAVCLPRSAVTLQAILGIWRAGAVFVPLDPSHPSHRWSFVVADCGARAVVCAGDADAGRLRAALPGPAGTGPVVLRVEDVAPNPSSGPVEDVAAEALPVEGSAPAYILYTSGSTGTPKGVVVGHDAFAQYVRCAGELYKGASGPAPWHSPLIFDATATALWVPLAHGGEILVVPGSDPLSGLEGLGLLLEEQREIGILKITPTHLESLAEWLGPEWTGNTIASLVVGGEAFRPDQALPWLPLCDQIVNEYGPTESTVGVVVAEVTDRHVDEGVIPVGHPLPGTEILLLGADDTPVAHGEAGELCVAGTQLADGYLNRPELTAERFPPHPLIPGARMYRTGDLARVGRDGELLYLGRIDEQIKFRGQRIEPAEIEAALNGHSEVVQSAVVLRSDRLVAHVVAVDALRPPRGQDLAAYLKELLPPGWVPQLFEPLDRLPVTHNGKLDRKALVQVTG